jgi:hypothetical protein
MKKVMQPFKAPRYSKAPSSPKVADSEVETQLVCSRWVVKETQEADIVQSDNDSEGKTDLDELNGNGERWNFEARIARSPVAHNGEDTLNTTAASPNVTEFEAFLEKETAQEREPLIVETSYQHRQQKLSKTDAYWEGVLQSEKQRLQKINDEALTPSTTPSNALLVRSPLCYILYINLTHASPL